MPRLTGARGAASYEYIRQDSEAHPLTYSRRIRDRAEQRMTARAPVQVTNQILVKENATWGCGNVLIGHGAPETAKMER